MGPIQGEHDGLAVQGQLAWYDPFVSARGAALLCIYL
jgi:hypothetical protein